MFRFDIPLTHISLFVNVLIYMIRYDHVNISYIFNCHFDDIIENYPIRFFEKQNKKMHFYKWQ